MNPIFIPLLAGHLIADFWLQPVSWVECKRENGWKSKMLLFHALLAAFLPVLFTLQGRLWWFLPIIFCFHYLVDFLKIKTRDNLFVYILDQTLHIGLLWILAKWGPHYSMGTSLLQFWIYATGFILVTTPMGISIGKFLQTITKTEFNPMKTDPSAWIGIVERILIVVFVLVGQLQAIGFLVAAKSVFRFSETQKEGNSKAAYFLLGTLVSFLVAIIIGLGIKFLVK